MWKTIKRFHMDEERNKNLLICCPKTNANCASKIIFCVNFETQRCEKRKKISFKFLKRTMMNGTLKWLKDTTPHICCSFFKFFSVLCLPPLSILELVFVSLRSKVFKVITPFSFLLFYLLLNNRSMSKAEIALIGFKNEFFIRFLSI